MRQEVSLDGTWRFQIDRDEQGEVRGWQTFGYQPSDWLEAPVPGSWDTYLDGLFGYAGHAWYRRAFSVDPAWRDTRVYLRLEGANYETSVWLNGQLVGTHRGGFDPFQFDVTDVLRWEGENVLAARVDNWPRVNRVPNSLAGWWNYGGIYRSVRLLALPSVRIADVAVQAKPGTEDGAAPLRVDLALANDGDQRAEMTVSASVRADEQSVLLAGALAAGPVAVAAGAETAVRLEAGIPDARLWSPDAPNLYKLDVRLEQDGEVVDELEVTFGVRSFEVRGTQLYLNGEPIRLRGFNRHEEYAGTGRVDPGGTLEADVRMIKAMNGNMVRMHYEAHPDLYDLADRLGLLVFAEIPAWQVGVKDVAEWSDPDVRQTAETMLRTLIGELKNHPSVVIWSVGNECATNRVEARPLIGHLANLARSLDPTRPVAYVAMYGPEEKCFDLVDIPCMNTYFGKRIDQLGAHVDRVHALEPDKPLMITEFGHEAVRGLHGEGYGTEDEQALALEQHFHVFQEKADFIPGTLIWCLADYWHMPMGADFHWLNRVYFCHGVTTLAREPKVAVDTVRRLFASQSREQET